MKKIALIGSAPSSVRIAPYNSPDWEVWACSPGAWSIAGPHAHKWFELHRWEPGQPWLSKEYCQFLENFPGEVITSAPVTSIKNNRVIDVELLVNTYGPYFFTSSLSWMFAMAIDAGATSIGLWGVDMAASEEYGYQRAGCQYFALVARSLGIEVGVPPESDLLRPPPLYGVCENSHQWIKSLARERELKERLARVDLQLKQAELEKVFVQGAIDDLQWNQQTWFGNIDTMGRGYIEPPVVPAIAPVVTISQSDLSDQKVNDEPPRRTRRKGKQAQS